MQKTAIIVPFRDDKKLSRSIQLSKFVSYMSNYLNDISYKIFVVRQSDDSKLFNGGKLKNIGFKYAQKEGYTNFVFNDVDLLPSIELQEFYINTPKFNPIHIAAVWNRYGGNPKYFGGILSFNENMFIETNGYPNDFWGWGGEDDELYLRTIKFYKIYKPEKGKAFSYFGTIAKRYLIVYNENNYKKLESEL